MSSRELQEVSGGAAEWARRIRELRDEEGYDILTHNDLESLKPGEYILQSPKPRPAFARSVSKEIRSLVLARNGFTCQMCGAGAGEPNPFDTTKKTRLHIGHIIDKSHGGSDDFSNLRAICSTCNEGAANIALATADVLQVLSQLRKTPRSDQVRILEFLVTKFPDDTQRLLDKSKQ